LRYSLIVSAKGFTLVVTDEFDTSVRLGIYPTVDRALQAAREHAGKDIAVPLALS
jgi:hypothetical protein